MRDLEKQIAEMERMDRVYQSSAEMVRHIEVTANIGRQINDLAMSAASSGKRLQDQVDQVLGWQKNMERAEKLLRTTSSAESALRSLQAPSAFERELHVLETSWSAASALRSLQSPSVTEEALRSSWTVDSRDRTGVQQALDAFRQNERPLREAMADIEKRRTMIELVKEREATASEVENAHRVLRNVSAHWVDHSVEDGVDQPLSKPLVVDVEKNLDAIQRAKVDQEDFLAESEAPNAPTEPAAPPTVYGDRMMGFADVFFSAEDLERVFEPFVTDYRMEMGAAAGNPEKMREIQTLYRKQFALAVLGAAWATFCRLFSALRRS